MDDARKKWLAERRCSIGGSDAAAAICCSRWATRLDVWSDKALGVTRPRTPDAEHAMMIGHLLEDDVAELYSRETGRRLVPGSWDGLGIVRSTEHPFMHATIDYHIIAEQRDGEPFEDYAKRARVAVLQCKTTSARNARHWRQQPPIEAQIQLQHELAVTGYAWGSLACLAGTWEFFREDYERHERFIALMVELERELWGYVERCEEPDPMQGGASRQGLTQAFGVQTTLDGCCDVIERVNEELAKEATV